MRIIIASRIFSPEPAAASFMLEAVARRFAAAGHHVVVLTTTPPRGVSPVDIPDVIVRRFPVLRDRSGYVRGYLPYLSFDIPLLFRLLFRRRADLYFVEPPPTTGAVVRTVTGLLRRPYFYDAADIWSDAASMATSSALILWLLRRVEKFAMEGAYRAFTISSGVADRMRELGISTPTTVIGFGVDVDVFRFEEATPSERPYFVYAGTYSEWHGAGIFVEAFARFVKEHPMYRLVFVGNGTDRAQLEKQSAELGLDSVEFLDPVDPLRLTTLLASAAGALASLEPGGGYDYAFTTKVYSSLAVGCPTVFTGVGPTKDFLDGIDPARRAGVAVAYNADAVASALAEIAADPAPPQRRRALSDWARQNFSLSAIADTVVNASLAGARR